MAATARRAIAPPAARTKLGLIVGPTGIGKTALALEVAERIGAEIVNADSRQLYRGMDHGTAKPSMDEQARVPHHLLDVCAIDRPIDVAEFAVLARRAIADISARGRRALVVGGSGMYLRVLRDGIFAGPAASLELRESLNRVADECGDAALHARLMEVDPEAAARISPHDRMRLVRALEVYELTGTALSAHQRAHRFAASPYDSLTIGLTAPRAALYAAINRRFAAMLKAGLVEEVRSLIAAGYNPGAAPLNTIGYGEICDYCCGRMSLEAAVEKAQQRSRNLAKRQMTWFRGDKTVEWFEVERGAGPIIGRLEQFLTIRELD